MLILDDFAMREHTATQADDLYELISDRAVNGRPLILTSNRSPKDWYPLFPNPVVAESLLDRLINTSHQILMDGPSYRPRKRPGDAPTRQHEGRRVDLTRRPTVGNYVTDTPGELRDGRQQMRGTMTNTSDGARPTRTCS